MINTKVVCVSWVAAAGVTVLHIFCVTKYHVTFLGGGCKQPERVRAWVVLDRSREALQRMQVNTADQHWLQDPQRGKSEGPLEAGLRAPGGGVRWCPCSEAKRVLPASTVVRAEGSLSN